MAGGTDFSAADGPRGIDFSAVDGPGGPLLGGTNFRVTYPVRWLRPFSLHFTFLHNIIVVLLTFYCYIVVVT